MKQPHLEGEDELCSAGILAARMLSPALYRFVDAVGHHKGISKGLACSIMQVRWAPVSNRPKAAGSMNTFPGLL